MRNLLTISLFAILVVALATDSSRSFDHNSEAGVQGFPDEFAKYFHNITVKEDQDVSGYKTGYRQASLKELRAARKSSGSSLAWVERGPGNFGGRTRTIVIDANDPTGQTWFAGSVGGGIWKTTDKGTPGSWVALTDDLPRLAVSTIVQAPSNPSIFYAGTGEGYPNIDSVIGDGILKSTDGGTTWIPLSSTQSVIGFRFVNRLIVSPSDPNLVLAATQGGIMRSSDGGGSWIEVKEPDSFRGFTQIVDEPENFNIQYAVDEGSGIWKSLDAGMSWTLSSYGLSEAGTGNRIEIGVSPADPARLYALVESGDGPDPVYVSKDRAGLWLPFQQANLSPAIDIAGSQGWYDQMVTPHPFDANVVFMGGLRIHRLTETGSRDVSYFIGVEEEGTSPFLSFINFTAPQFGGALRLGTEEEESTISASQMVSVEVRFGSGLSQFAHRFVPPDVSGVDFADYPYKDYVEVPFEVWDITNNRQLHVSFRDRSDDGLFDLIEREENDLGREYVMISSRPYTGATPDPDIAQNGGVVNDLAYFFWPILTPGATWDASDLPESILRFNYLNVSTPTRTTSTVGSAIHVDQHTLAIFETGTEGEAFELVAGNDGGVFYSGDAGSNWIDRSRGYNTSQFYGVDKKPGGDVYIGGTQDNGSWRSLGNPSAASAWQPAFGGDGFDAIWHKQDDKRLIVSSQWTNIRRSVNGGIQFTDATTGLTDTGSGCDCAQFITTLAYNHLNGDIVYTIGKSGVWKSVDFAASWTLTAIPEADWGYGSSGKVRVSNSNPEIVWAGYEMDATLNGANDDLGKLQVSNDGGDTFVSTTTPEFAPGRLAGLSTSHDEDSVAYATFSFFDTAKVLRTNDMGQTWEDISGFHNGPPGVISQRGFPDVATFDMLDFPDSPVLWAATEIGVVESLDDGLSWNIADNGLPAVSIWQMRLIEDQVVLATHGRGVWSLPLSEVPTDVEDAAAEIPVEFELESVYPNPFGSAVTVRWSANIAGRAVVRIFNIQGRLIATLFDGQVPAGQHEHSWNGAGASAGAYFVQIETVAGTKTRAMIRLH